MTASLTLSTPPAGSASALPYLAASRVLCARYFPWEVAAAVEAHLQERFFRRPTAFCLLDRIDRAAAAPGQDGAATTMPPAGVRAEQLLAWAAPGLSKTPEVLFAGLRRAVDAGLLREAGDGSYAITLAGRRHLLAGRSARVAALRLNPQSGVGGVCADLDEEDVREEELGALDLRIEVEPTGAVWGPLVRAAGTWAGRPTRRVRRTGRALAC